MDLSEKEKVIKNYCVFNIKSDGYYRSQLVVKGFSQIKGINFDELFSLVVNYKTAYLFLADTVLEYWNIHSIHTKTTYLYNDLDKIIYKEQHEGFRLSNKKKKV